jgi:hypothetical protein
MNWFKRNYHFSEHPEVMILRHSPEGINVLIDSIRYFCPNNIPTIRARLEKLIQIKAWGKAKQLCNTIGCRREELPKNNRQLELF